MKRTSIYLADSQAIALDRMAEAAGISRVELIRGLIDRAIGGQPGADLVVDLAAIYGSFGVLAGQETFTCRPDERMGYLDGLAGELIIPGNGVLIHPSSASGSGGAARHDATRPECRSLPESLPIAW